MTFSGFIDIVGVRRMAQDGDYDFHDQLSSFIDKIATASIACLDGAAGDRAHIFSDCAFFESRSYARMRDFMLEVRSDLLAERIFFKAALHRGPLESQDALEALSISEGRRRKLARYISGVSFGARAARLYGMQASYKGIGIRVDDDLLKSAAARRDVRRCAFVADTRRRRHEAYLDFAFLRSDLRPEMLNRILEAAYDAMMRSTELGRYYTALLILWAQSIPLERAVLDAPDCDELFRLLCTRELERHFGDLPGIELILFALLGRAEEPSEEAPADLRDQLLRMLAGRRRWTTRIESVPEQLLSGRAKRRLYRDLSRKALR